jgi:hypothetical protein
MHSSVDGKAGECSEHQSGSRCSSCCATERRLRSTKVLRMASTIRSRRTPEIVRPEVFASSTEVEMSFPTLSNEKVCFSLNELSVVCL